MTDSVTDGFTKSEHKEEETGVYSLRISAADRKKALNRATVFAMPTDCGWDGYTYVLPNSLLKEDGDALILTLPKKFNVTLTNEEGNKEILSAPYFAQRINEAADAQKASAAAGGEFAYITLPKAARLGSCKTDAGSEGTIFKMPNGGKYEGNAFFFPNSLLKENTDGSYRLTIPPKFTFFLQQLKEKSTLDRETFLNAMKDVKEDDFKYRFDRPGKVAFEKLKEKLIANIPEAMKARPNWIAVTTIQRADKEHLNKKLIDCHTGQWAKSNDPSTWTTFEEALRYAQENGADTVAYALDGKDKIACIDVDHCIDENGKYSETAKDVFERSAGTYCERSISGKGLHFFAYQITIPEDLRSFSRDGKLEFYREGKFIAMTGDLMSKRKELGSFDTADMREYLMKNFDKRVEWRGEGQGLTGLSMLSDQQVLEKAFGSKNGARIKALYDGEDLQNNHSNSDMALMSHLAFFCNGDKEQMLRIFATSGLFRREKSPSYYETTALKAVQNAVGYRGSYVKSTAPKPSAPAVSGNTNSK